MPKKAKIILVRAERYRGEQRWALHQFYNVLTTSDKYEVYLVKTFPDTDGMLCPQNIRSGFFARKLSGYIQLFKIFREIRPDIVHFNNNIGVLFGLILAKYTVSGVRVILDLRTPPPDTIRVSYYKVVSRFFDWVFALNAPLLNTVRNPNKSILELGYDEETFFPSVAVESPNNKFLIYYGSLDVKRQVTVLVEAYLQAIDELQVMGTKCKNVKLIIVGAGSQLAQLRKLAKDSSVEILDPIPQRQLADILRNCYFGIAYIPHHPMFEYNLPLKTVEMLACGLQLVATNTMGNKLVCTTNNSILIDEDIQSIKRILKDIILNNTIVANRISISKNVSSYTWKDIVSRQLIPVYEKMLSNSTKWAQANL